MAGNTQEFLKVKQIKNDVVVLKGGHLRAVMMASSINFTLKSGGEREAIIAAYQDVVNSLDYPLQILITSRQLNLKPYLKELKNKEESEENELMRMQINEYINFITSLVEITNIINKRFYVVVPLNVKEAGGIFSDSSGTASKDFKEKKSQLWQRVKNVKAGLGAMGVRGKILETEQLIELMYNFYNPATQFQNTTDMYKQLY